MAKNGNIGSLFVKLGLDSAEFHEGLKQGQGALATFGKAAAAGLAVVATAAAAAGAAVAAGVKSAIDAADELSKTSQKIGVGVSALSGLKYAADLSDVSLEQLSGGLKKLSVSIVAAASDADSKAAGAFRALGVSVTDANGAVRSTDAIFADLAGGFAGIEDGATKTALAVALFGKSGSDLIPLLNSGKDGLAAMRAEAESLGLVISEETGKSAEAFNDNLTRLKAVGQGLTTQLAAALLPALQSITGGLVGVTKNAEVMRGVGVLLGGTLKVLASAAVVVGVAFSNLGRALQTNAQAIAQVFRGDFQGAFDTLKGGVTKNLQALGSAAGSIKAIWTNAGQAVAATAPATGAQLAAPATEAARKARAATKEIQSEAQKAAAAMREYVGRETEGLDRRGQTAEQAKIRELQAKASEALKLGLTAEADALLVLIDRYRQLEIEQVKVKDGQVDLTNTSADLTAALSDQAASSADDFEKTADAFYQIGNAVDDVFRGVASNDWVGAFSGLTRALAQVKDAFGQAGTSAKQFAAIAGAANAVGGAIGGTGGAAISGAASGALTGFQVGGPVGAVVGGILGGLGGLFGASKAKKRAKKEAAARAKAEAEQKAKEIADTKRSLELEILRLQGKELEALAEARKDELAAMDPSLRALVEQKYALEDQAVAAAKAAEMVATRTSLERELLRLQDGQAAVAADRADALAALDPSFRALQQGIFDVIDAQERWAQIQQAADEQLSNARDDLAAATDAEADRLKDLAGRFQDLAEGIAAVRKEIDQADLQGGDPRRRAAVASADLARISALAATGNEQALADLPDAIRTFVDAQRATATSRGQLDAQLDVARKAAAIGEAAARSQASDAEQQLQALYAQTDTLLGIERATLSVGDAIKGLEAAQMVQNNVIAAAVTAVQAIAASIPASIAQAVNDNAAAAAATAAANAASAFDPTPLFADPGAVAATANLAAGSGVDLLAAAIAAHLQPSLDQMVVNTGQTARTLDDVTQGGDALRTQAA